jgi:HEAT repeats
MQTGGATLDLDQTSAAATDLTPVTTPFTQPDSSNLEALAQRSSTHAEVARLLEDWAELSGLNLNRGNLIDFQERQRREEELLARIRSMGPLVIDVLQEMILEIDQRGHQLFMAKALAGMNDPAAFDAVRAILGQVKDVAVQTTLVRYLPETADAAGAIGDAYGSEDNATLRNMLLREYARRSDGSDDAGRELFRAAALNDPDASVRAEAVTIIGRRGDSRDQGLMEEIIRQDSTLTIRQRAIVAYAETGQQGSLGFLDQIARDPDSGIRIRASAVLAIGRVGGTQAISMLENLATSDPDQDIRVRAQRMATSLRARQQEAQNPNPDRPLVEGPPLRVDPEAIPRR